MPTRAEILADHFIRSAGIAAVYVDPDGTVGAVDVVSLFTPPGRVMLCCAPGSQTKVMILADGRTGHRLSQDQALAAVRAAAAEVGVTLTPFRKVVQRAFAALAIVDRTLDDLKAAGQLRDLNRDFAELRKATPGLRYQDHLHAKKMAMVEALAKQAG